MRLFIAIGLPLPLSETLAHAARTLIPSETQQHARVTFTRPENMHLTLSFLGQVDPSRLDTIQQTLATIHTSRLHIHLDGVRTFTNAGILYAAIKPSTSLLAFAEQIFQSMERCGFPRESRPYTPHITLAHSRGGSKGRLRLPHQDHPVFHKSFEAQEFRLYESFTLPQGAQYEVRKAFPLI